MLYEALAISKEMDDRHEVVSIYATMGWQWVWQGRFEEARAMYQRLWRPTMIWIIRKVWLSKSMHISVIRTCIWVNINAARYQALHAIELLRSRVKPLLMLAYGTHIARIS